MKVIHTISDLFYDALSHGFEDAMSYKVDGRYVALGHQEIQARVERLALALRAEGILLGDRAALLSENRPEWAMADYACAILGVVTVPVYPTLSMAQTEFILGHSGSRIVFCSTRAQLAKVLDAWGRLPDLALAVLMEGAAPRVPGRRILAWEGLQAAGALREAERERVRAWAGEREPEELLTLIYTSGTTGEPKGAMLTHGNLVSNLLAGLEILQVRPGLRCLSLLPLSHIFERSCGHFALFHAGVRITYLDDPANLSAALLEVRPEVLLAVPRVFEKIYARIREAASVSNPLRRLLFRGALWAGRKVAALHCRGLEPGPALGLVHALADRLVLRKVRDRLGGRLQIAASGGAALGPKVMEFFWAVGVPVFEGYGLTETSPILALSARGHVKPGFVGRPILDTWRGRPFLRIAPDGEILCQGPGVTRGYWRDREATAEAFDGEGYFRTGDIGELDAEGRLRITDRKKDLLVTSGGKNVAPQPIERLLAQDPFITQAVVVGDRRNFLGAVVVANLVNLRRWAARVGLPFRSDAELVARPEAVAMVMARVERVNRGLSHFERIRKIVLVHEEMTLESGLLTPSLKIKRRAVDARYADRIAALYGREGAG
jgi:long-chain acyl-CoA synthetase